MTSTKVLVEKEILVVPDDVKEAFKILNTWLKKLSKRNIDLFKKSDDYARYKEILQKYELVKRKP
ncbi:MAG: hypothetical protein HC945_01695 [Nitrosarchaeum sp.]|nr:hypothetical protein [Nitrosarchaeum sp.]